MTFEEAYKKWNSDGISMLVVLDGSLISVSQINASGGCCDCCRYTNLDDFKSASVARVVEYLFCFPGYRHYEFQPP